MKQGQQTIYYPAIITSAIFLGAIFINYTENDYEHIMINSLFAIPAILCSVYLSQTNHNTLAYFIILIPFLFVFLSYNAGVNQSPQRKFTWYG